MPSTNSVYCGDAIEMLQAIENGSVDLVYLDPPFFSQRAFSGTKHLSSFSFNDVWPGGIREYLDFISNVLVQTYRILKDTGVIFVHCDAHASHYIKVEADAIFGYRNFRNEIIWRRHNVHNDSKQGCKSFGKVHDSILFYSKTENYRWNNYHIPYTVSHVQKQYRHIEPETGRRYALGDLSGPGGASKGNPYFSFLGITRYWRYNERRMNELLKQGRIVRSKKSGHPYLKRYLDEMSGVAIQDIWDDIPSAHLRKKDYSGYPTEKPVELLKRIILSTTTVGDVVIDPFCGSGTTLVAAELCSRKWIGFDKSERACQIAKERLRKISVLETVPKIGI